VSIRQIIPDIFGLCSFALSRLCVESVKVVKVVMAKNHPCNLLTMNGVKPSQGKSNQLRQGVKVAGTAANFAGLGIDQSGKQVNASSELAMLIISHLISDHLNLSHIKNIIFIASRLTRHLIAFYSRLCRTRQKMRENLSAPQQ
jgi:hypothetical protein